MKRVLGVSLLAGMMVVGGMVLAGPASAATIDVHPGESIQAAINHASPGDVIVVHPGVYHESVVVNKDHLTLRGAGAGANGTVIEPPESSNRCLHGAAGFCVFGKKTESGFHRRTGVTVEGFEFKGFPAFGLVGFGVKDLLVQRNFGVDNGEYGLTCFNCAGISFLYNKATGAGESGFYVGDSREADALLVGNLAFGNGTTGFLFRDANVGRAKGNKAYGNCSVPQRRGVQGRGRGPAAVLRARDRAVRREEQPHPAQHRVGEPAHRPLGGVGRHRGGVVEELRRRQRVRQRDSVQRPVPEQAGRHPVGRHRGR